MLDEIMLKQEDGIRVMPELYALSNDKVRNFFFCHKNWDVSGKIERERKNVGFEKNKRERDSEVERMVEYSGSEKKKRVKEKKERARKDRDK